MRLEPLNEAQSDEIAALDAVSSWTAQMGGSVRRQTAMDDTADAMVIRDVAASKAVGVITARQEEDYPGTFTVSLFVDAARSRAGWALEAFLLFTVRQFDHGKYKLVFEVLAFNEPVLRLMRKIGLAPEATLRAHAYVAGRRWDMLVFGLTSCQFDQVLAEHPRWTARPPAALGGSRK